MQDTSPKPASTEALEAPGPAPAPSNRSALLIVFLVVFIDLLGFGIVLPLLPVIGLTYVGQLIPGGTSEEGNALAGMVVGALMASFSLMQFLGAPIWGRLSDRFGRRPILLIGLGGSVVFYALFGYACTMPAETQAALALTLLFVARIGQGLAGATIGTAQAVIADSTPPEKRKHGMALIGAAFGIGFTFGPILAAIALLSFPNHLEAVGYVASSLSFIALMLGLWLLPETRRFDKAPPIGRTWLNWSATRLALSNAAIGPVILAFFLATLGFASFETTLALFLESVLKFEKYQTYLIFAYVGVVLMLTQGLLYRRLARRLTEPTFMTIGIVLMALGLVGLGIVTLTAGNVSLPDVLLKILLFGSLAVAVVGFAFLTPSAQALVSRRADPNEQGEILGVNQSAAAMARILGPLIGVTLFKLMTPPLLPYAFGALVLVGMLPLMPRIRRG
jgi:DHA1 family tetracycline resistance protein-like MFS transporter